MTIKQSDNFKTILLMLQLIETLNPDEARSITATLMIRLACFEVAPEFSTIVDNTSITSDDVKIMFSKMKSFLHDMVDKLESTFTTKECLQDLRNMKNDNTDIPSTLL